MRYASTIIWASNLVGNGCSRSGARDRLAYDATSKPPATIE